MCRYSFLVFTKPFRAQASDLVSYVKTKCRYVKREKNNDRSFRYSPLEVVNICKIEEQSMTSNTFYPQKIAQTDEQ